MDNSEASFYSELFTVAGPRRKRKRRTPQELTSQRVLLDRVADELNAASWFKDCHQILRDSISQITFVPQNILCLGLGSPTSSKDARAQLAFLVRLCDALEINRRDVSIYDPVFTHEDIILLCGLHLQVIEEKKNAGYTIKRPTLVFMPHCDITLYEAILRQNWSMSRLPNVIFIANHFQEYIDSIPKRRLVAEFPCLQRLAEIVQAKRLPALSNFETAFNNTSCQFVHTSALPSITDDTFWSFPPSSLEEAHVPCT